MARSKKVLIAEDSSVIQNLTKQILTFKNFQITTAKNGEEVLKLVMLEDFDVILMDIAMPKMDGLQCARAIREMEDQSKSTVPIIAVTGNALNMDLEAYQKEGIDDFLPKPLDFDKLVALVERHTSK